MTYQIIRTAEDLDSCDSDDVLVTWGAQRAQPWLEVFEDDLPAVVLATGGQVRAARKALGDAA